MGDVVDYFKEEKKHRRALRILYGEDCPECLRLRPKTNASILLPGQKCRVDWYVDPRPELTHEQYANAVIDLQKRNEK